jgi:magnesium-transporting ATPase (P-type)
MISGDHHSTAVEVARKAGIVTLEDLELEDTVMDA